MKRIIVCGAAILLALLGMAVIPLVQGADYDLVLRGGRVIDPETKLDATRNVGIKDSGGTSPVGTTRLSFSL